VFLVLLASSLSTRRNATGTSISMTRTLTIRPSKRASHRAIHRTFEEDLPLAFDDSALLESSISLRLFVLFASIGGSDCIVIPCRVCDGWMRLLEVGVVCSDGVPHFCGTSDQLPPVRPAGILPFKKMVCYYGII
jgi:hypothetical protein